MILVIGATGTVGSEVLRQLVAAAQPVRAVARTPDKASTLRESGVEVVLADLADPPSLDAALGGVDHVFLATPAAEDQVALEGNLVDAISRSETRPHLVKLAALGYDAAPPEQATKFAANHARVVQRIRDQGIPHTVLAPSGFMTSLLGSAATIAQGALYGSAGDGGLAWIDPQDIGAVATHVLTTPGHEGRSYAITGPEVLSHEQVAKRLSGALDREVRYVDVPAEQFQASLQSVGLPAWTAEALTELHQRYREHHAEVVTDEVEKATGRPATSLDDWLSRHRAAFGGRL